MFSRRRLTRSSLRCLGNQRNTIWRFCRRIMEIATVQRIRITVWKALWPKKRNQLERLVDWVLGLVVMVFRRIVTTERVRILITKIGVHAVTWIVYWRRCYGWVDTKNENQKRSSMSSSSYSTEYFLRKTRSSTQRKRVYGEMRDKQVLIDHTQRKVTIQHKITSVPKGRLVIFKPRVQIVVETGAGHIVHNTRKKRKRKGYSILLR